MENIFNMQRKIFYVQGNIKNIINPRTIGILADEC